MGIIIGILLVIFALSAILLVLIVLAQDDGAEGAGMIFGSAASQQYGVRKGNIVTKTTSILATTFLVLAFALAFLLKGNDNTSELQKASQQQDSSDTTAVEWWKEIPSDSAVESDTKDNSKVQSETSVSDPNGDGQSKLATQEDAEE